MTLRCRKGDMAIVLDPSHYAYGWLVDVKEFYGNGIARNRRKQIEERIVNGWFIAHERLPLNDVGWVCEDRMLLPIRPGDIDETEESSKELEVAK